MKILVYGSDKFDDYSTFMRGIVVAMENGVDRLDILTAGPHKINSFAAEFVNRSEVFLKQKGVRSSFRRVRYSDIADSFDDADIDFVIYFSHKGDHKHVFDTIISKAEEKNIPTNVYKI